VPVVGTNSGGVAELVDTETGLLAEPNDVGSLAGAIEAIFQRDLVRMGEAARRKAVERYDWNEILPQVIARYEALLGGHSRVLHVAVDERERIRVMD
jgi:alpha-1,6-mannosyltransferase